MRSALNIQVVESKPADMVLVKVGGKYCLVTKENISEVNAAAASLGEPELSYSEVSYAVIASDSHDSVVREVASLVEKLRPVAMQIGDDLSAILYIEPVKARAFLRAASETLEASPGLENFLDEMQKRGHDVRHLFKATYALPVIDTRAITLGIASAKHLLAFLDKVASMNPGAVAKFREYVSARNKSLRYYPSEEVQAATILRSMYGGLCPESMAPSLPEGYGKLFGIDYDLTTAEMDAVLKEIGSDTPVTAPVTVPGPKDGLVYLLNQKGEICASAPDSVADGHVVYAIKTDSGVWPYLSYTSSVKVRFESARRTLMLGGEDPVKDL